jgi:cold shock CspA family protein
MQGTTRGTSGPRTMRRACDTSPASQRRSYEDVFFHRSALVGVSFDQLRQGDHVMFTAENDPRGKGPRAADVRLVTP